MIDKQIESSERDDASSLKEGASGIGSVEPSPLPLDQTRQKPPKDTLRPKSEQVQSIIERMPTHSENTGGECGVFII